MEGWVTVGVHRFSLLLGDKTKPGRAPGRRAAALAAAAVVGGGMWLTVPAASAANPECLSCINLFNQKFGTADVAAVSGAAASGRPVTLSASAPSTIENWTQAYQGAVSDFVAAGLMNATLGKHYGTDPAFEFQYAPGGSPSGLCLGTAAAPGSDTPVTLQSCGQSVNTIWIADTANGSGGYTPFISGNDTKYPAPYVLTADTAGGNLVTKALKTDGAAVKAQRWQATLFGTPAGNYKWNGYVTNGSSATDVAADWTVPSIALPKCGVLGNSASAEWVGLGGVNASLVQIGTLEVCGEAPTAVYEIVPEMPTAQRIGLLLPGNKIEAEVKYLGAGQYYLSIIDQSLGWTWHQTVTQPASSATPQTAEWIEEDTGTLADFGTLKFTNCFWNNGSGLSALTSGTVYTGVNTSGDLETSVSPIRAGGNGPAFTITWLHS
jgi:hypothetical protein